MGQQMTISPQFSYQTIKPLIHSQRRVLGSHASIVRTYLGPAASTCLWQPHPKICLTGGYNHAGRGRDLSKTPAWGNPSYRSPEKTCLSHPGEQQAPPVWFLSRYTEANPRSVADPQLVFSLIYVRTYLCPLLKTIQFMSAVNGTT